MSLDSGSGENTEQSLLLGLADGRARRDDAADPLVPTRASLANDPVDRRAAQCNESIAAVFLPGDAPEIECREQRRGEGRDEKCCPFRVESDLTDPDRQIGS
jgi:hypothetical protein